MTPERDYPDWFVGMAVEGLIATKLSLEPKWTLIDGEPCSWFVIYTTAQGERKTVEEAERLGYTVFYPKRSVWKRHPRSRKRELVERPLFPRYLFLAMPKDRSRHVFMPLLLQKTVIELLSWCDEPLQVDAKLIEKMQAEIARGEYDDAVVTAQKLAAMIGRSYEFHSGLWQGFVATVMNARGSTANMTISAAGGATFMLKIPLSELDRNAVYRVEDDQQAPQKTRGRNAQ